MLEVINQFIIPITIVACVVGSAGIATLIIVLNDKISWVSLTRFGVEVRTNDIPVWRRITDRVDRIDSSNKRSIRKGTTGLLILDPNQYEMSADAMLVNYEANQPLMYAAYENQFTRELATDKDKGNVYIRDKAADIITEVQLLRKSFPELTEELADCYVHHWIDQVIIPNLRKTCTEKVVFYKQQLARKDISKTIKDILIECRDKNEGYLQCINKLDELSDIKNKSTIFYRVPS